MPRLDVMTVKTTQPASQVQVDIVQVQLAIAGDSKARSAIVARLDRHLRRRCARLASRQLPVDDWVQDTLIEVLGSLSSFGGHAQLTTWVESIARRVAFRHRHRDVLTVDPCCEVDSGTPASDRIVDGRQQLRAVNRLMRSMSNDQHRTFVLFAIEGYSIAEVAQKTGCSQWAVKSRLCRARKLLRTAQWVE